MINDVEIFVLYSSQSGREVSFLDIVQQKNIMDIEDYVPMVFWGATGGIQIVIDKHNTIFNSSDFHYLVKATSFLLHSMYWIQDKENDWFDLDDDCKRDLVLKTTNNDLIRIGKVGLNELSLSYISTNKNYVRKRGDKFFEGITINKMAWYNASKQALTEYFKILLKIVQNNPEDETGKTMKNYYNLWQNIMLL